MRAELHGERQDLERLHSFDKGLWLLYVSIVEPHTITLKNLPPDLHKALSDRAKRNHRSLNGGILATLQASLHYEPDVEILLAEADRFVEKLSLFTAPAEIARYRSTSRW